MEIGPCRGTMKRFFFNVSSQKCEEFSYGKKYSDESLDLFDSIFLLHESLCLLEDLIESRLHVAYTFIKILIREIFFMFFFLLRWMSR